LVVIPFPFPKVQVYVAAGLAPVELFTKLTASGEHPDKVLGVKSATNCDITGEVPASKKKIANRKRIFLPEIRLKAIGRVLGYWVYHRLLLNDNQGHILQ
jgi:hypothetical protein